MIWSPGFCHCRYFIYSPVLCRSRSAFSLLQLVTIGWTESSPKDMSVCASSSHRHYRQLFLPRRRPGHVDGTVSPCPFQRRQAPLVRETIFPKQRQFSEQITGGGGQRMYSEDLNQLILGSLDPGLPWSCGRRTVWAVTRVLLNNAPFALKFASMYESN